MAGADADRGDLEIGAGEAGEGASDRGQTEVTGEAARFDVDAGEDEEPGHAPGEDDAALAASRLRSQAAYELPAAVSLPENRIARMRA